MGTVKSLIRIIIATSWVALLMKVVPVVLPYPHGSLLRVEERMFMPPTFGTSSLPPGYSSSGLFCNFLTGGPYRRPYTGGWFNRACQGPIPPFIYPTSSTTTTSTTSKPVLVAATTVPVPLAHGNANYPNPYADYGDPIEGSPWEPDDEDLFIENYGKSASNPNFRLGDPSRIRH
ncbi:unnamed protein product [Orchesella dallaii]|uniref:Uncharacterized protein n=1 Tax=Orchesella dallaii TaxID=48710 RepID=A0ABP1Q8U0_9HEXA